ncbi:integral membrane protein, putative [Cordyceps militaris CM01]|uniref:Integral membrane protein, putative n=2 Tax=Cordyceps militaris TaxID=73501 RepID=G3JI63_CORMM|nr:integral membrane protein, putative [Cordyceps militaris CM01]ATY59147.1 integral membrane [Cordyceps militaris]EGX91016.1 integral membrane protein, putative [Cordyceps militaris CM01]
MAAAADNDARKDRIISHMNRDHTREMSHYLRHYNSLSRREAALPSLRDVSLDAMHIRAGGLNHEVPFVPPLTGWDQMRPRLVEMDTVARRELGVSDIVVTTYAPPRPGHWVILLAVTFYFVSAATLPWTGPGSTAASLLDRGFPGGAALFRWLVKVIFVPVLGIHIAECYMLDRLRLSRHGVERFTGIWFLWEISCFLEGFMTWRRFDELVAEKQKQKDAKKH